MAQQVYTIRMWDLTSTAQPGPFVGPQVPQGFVWVVRDVRMLNIAQPATAVAAPILLTSGGTLRIAASPTYSSMPGILYHWQGRAVAAPGEFLTAITTSPNWNMVVDGYQLSTP